MLKVREIWLEHLGLGVVTCVVTTSVSNRLQGIDTHQGIVSPLVSGLLGFVVRTRVRVRVRVRVRGQSHDTDHIILLSTTLKLDI